MATGVIREPLLLRALIVIDTKMKFLIALCLFFVGSNAQIVTSGPCPVLDAKPNFNLGAYLGLWNEIHRYENTFQFNGDCVTANYTLQANSTVGVLNNAVNNGSYYELAGIAVVDPEANGSGKLLVSFPGNSTGFAPYWVLATDYVDYSFVYSCERLAGNNRAVFSWILSRTKTLSPQAVLAVNEVIADVDTLSWSNYRETRQTETACRRN